MAEGRGQPEIGPFYIRMTEGDPLNGLPGARDIFSNLSLTSQFKVSLHLTNDDTDGTLMKWLKDSGVLEFSDNEYTTNYKRTNPFIYDFYCAETVIPGAQFDVAEEMGTRQGIIERFPTRRIFPEFTMTFYVDNHYNLIRLFEEWMNYVNPLYASGGQLKASSIGQGDSDGKDPRAFFRFRYPDDYRRTISITKFERNFNSSESTTSVGFPPHLTYRMIEAFPTNITAMPLTYEGSQITKTTVTFQYARYVMELNNGNLD